MTWRTALLAPALAGCSLIYNPNNLPTPRDGDGGVVSVDAPPVVDANDSLLALLDISPATINARRPNAPRPPAERRRPPWALTACFTLSIAST